MGFLNKLFGGGKNQGGGKMGELLQVLTSDLNLTPDQVNSIQKAFNNFKVKRKEIKSGGGDREQIQGARKQMIQEITGFLNDEQRKTFTANASKYDSILHGGQD